MRGRRAALDEVAAAYATATLPRRANAVARGRLVRRRPRADRARPAPSTRSSRSARSRSTMAVSSCERGVSGLVRRRARSARRRSACTGSAPPTSRARRRSPTRSSRCSGRSPGACWSPTTRRVERAFLRRGAARAGLRLRGPMVDTEVLGRVWLRERDGASAARPARRARDARSGCRRSGRTTRSATALTTAQVFIALAAHLDARDPETVGSLVAGRAQRLDALRAFHGR